MKTGGPRRKLNRGILCLQKAMSVQQIGEKRGGYRLIARRLDHLPGRKRRHQTVILRKRRFAEPRMVDRLGCLHLTPHRLPYRNPLVWIILQESLQQIDSLLLTHTLHRHICRQHGEPLSQPVVCEHRLVPLHAAVVRKALDLRPIIHPRAAQEIEDLQQLVILVRPAEDGSSAFV